MAKKPTCTLDCYSEEVVFPKTAVCYVSSFTVSGIPRTHILTQRTTPDGSHIFTLTKRTGRK